MLAYDENVGLGKTKTNFVCFAIIVLIIAHGQEYRVFDYWFFDKEINVVCYCRT